MSTNNINSNSRISDEIDVSLLKNITMRSKSRSKRMESNSRESSEIVSKNYILEHYNVSICTDNSTNIFMNVINKSTYQNYETIIYDHDLESNLTVEKFIKIVYGCFESANCSATNSATGSKINSSTKYTYNLELQTNSIIFHFHADFDGFFDVSQSITLLEKEISQDKQLSSKIIELESRIRELETKEIIFGFDTTTFNNFIKIKKNIDVLDLRPYNNSKYRWYGNLWEFNNFTNLKKIIMDDNQFKYDYNPCLVDTKTNIEFKFSNGQDINNITSMMINPNCGVNNSFPFSGYSASSVKPSFSHSATSTTTAQTQLDNMFNNTQLYFPNVTEIVFYRKVGTNFNGYTFKSLPNLKKVVFEQYENNQIATFDFIKNNNISHVVYNNCLNISQLDLIKNYFETNNLTLEIIKK